MRREQIGRILAGGLRHRVEQCACVLRLVFDGDARLHDGDVRSPEALRGTHGRTEVARIEPRIHARLVVGPRQQRPEHLEHLRFETGREVILAPARADVFAGCGAVSARQQRPCHRQLAESRSAVALSEKKAKTAAGSRRSDHSLASARRRKILWPGHGGLARTNAA